MKIFLLQTLCWSIALVSFFIVIPLIMAFDRLERAIVELINEDV
jgi:hypothetical protein